MANFDSMGWVWNWLRRLKIGEVQVSDPTDAVPAASVACAGYRTCRKWFVGSSPIPTWYTSAGSES
jgi:hypothetical protein